MSRGEVAMHTEPWVRATQVDGAGSGEDSRPYPGRPPDSPAREHVSCAERSSATAVVSREESAEVIVPRPEARGRVAIMVLTREAFGRGKDRTSKYRETSVSPRGRR